MKHNNNKNNTLNDAELKQMRAEVLKWIEENEMNNNKKNKIKTKKNFILFKKPLEKAAEIEKTERKIVNKSRTFLRKRLEEGFIDTPAGKVRDKSKRIVAKPTKQNAIAVSKLVKKHDAINLISDSRDKSNKKNAFYQLIILIVLILLFFLVFFVTQIYFK